MIRKKYEKTAGITDTHQGRNSSRAGGHGVVTATVTPKPCVRCSSEGMKTNGECITLDEYTTEQRDFLWAYIKEHYPGLDRKGYWCVPCLEEVERSVQQLQLASIGGRWFYADLSLGHDPILPTPLKMNADPRFTGKGVTIAFVDSAFAPHPDLIVPVNRVKAVYDAVNNTEIQDFERLHGTEPPVEAWHGTMTACAAAGNGFLSGSRYRGIAPDAELVLVKTMTPQYSVQTPQVTQALQWIRDNRERYGIKIVSLSVGVDETTDSLEHPVIALVEELVASGVVVVAASGNNPMQPLRPPGSAPAAITVGGYNDNNALEWQQRELWHSSYGTTPNGVRKPELLGPAIWVAAPILLHTDVKSEAEALFFLATTDDEMLMQSIPVLARETAITEALLAAKTPLRARSAILQRIRLEKQISPNYKHVDGTSFAAPIVSSIVAQLLEADPTLKPREIKRILTSTAGFIPDVPTDTQGYGVVRADKALQKALRKTTRIT